MQKYLVIVESRTTEKTINKYLSSKYIVQSSIGHVRYLINSQLINKQILKTSRIF